MHEIQKYGEIDIITLQNDDLVIKVTNLGCAIISLCTKDRYGTFADIVLGFDDAINYSTQDKYLGVLVGRCANRIAKGEFSINDKNYKLAINNGPNHLHGGNEGFDKKIFYYKIIDNGIEFVYISKDGEEGYPGNLKLSVSYILEGNKFTIKYQAISDEDTILNLTNHTYFNLSGKPSTIHNHVLKISAGKFGEIDKYGLTTGVLRDVADTPFDFRSAKKIGQDINSTYEQIKIGRGYDHPYILNDIDNQIELIDLESGRKMTVSTTMPCVQLYTANYLDGKLKGKNNWYYEEKSGVCLETQYFPNSINNGYNKDIILNKDTVYNSATTWIFETINR